MAVAVLVEIAGGTAEQYDAILAEMSLSGWPPPHNTIHIAGPTDGGAWRVVDVWDSAEAFQAFARDKIVPLTQKHGMTAQPRIEFWPVHNLTT